MSNIINPRPTLSEAKAAQPKAGVEQGPAGAAANQSSIPHLPLPNDTAWSIRVGIAILVFGFGGFMLWAALAPLDEGVPAPGTIVVEGKRKTLQLLSGGIVKELHVHESMMVKTGDVLIRLDDTIARANHDAAIKSYYAALAEEARLVAEQAQAREIRFPPELLEAREAPERAQEYMRVQQGVFQARRAALQGELAVLNENVRQNEEIAKGQQEQIDFLKPQLQGMRDLAEEGFMPRNRQLELERQFSDLQANAARVKSMVASAKLSQIQHSMDFRKEVELKLADVKQELASISERVRSTREELDRTVVKAPADGSVTGLQVFTVDTAVGAGQKLMDIVPVGDGLILEVQIPSHLIDRVRNGMPADIQFHSFVTLPNLIIEGELISVSADIIVADPHQQNTPPYYLGRVKVTPEGLKKLGQHQMQPGMPAAVVIKSGSRSLLDYIMKPLKRRLTESLTEA
ncbi:alkaline protease secretion protein AprE [Rhodocyclaceae bacterium]